MRQSRLTEIFTMVGKRTLSWIGLLASGVMLLAGCGGAPSENPNFDGGTGGGGSGTTRTINVSVEGTAGPVVVRLNSTDYTFDTNTTIQVNTFGLNDDVQATLISSPTDESCYFTPTNQQQIVVANSVKVECGGVEVRGKIKNFFTNDEIGAASISVTQAPSFEVVGSFESDAQGSYSFTVPAGVRTILTVTADGFAPYSAVVEPTDTRPLVIENIFLVPMNLTDSESPDADMTFRVAGIPVLNIPANGLQTSAGGSPSGSVTAAITLLDPAFSPRMLPGSYEFNDSGAISWLESFGGISFELTDDSGNVLELAGGVTALVSVPKGEGVANDPATPMVYVFDNSNGYWESPVAATTGNFGLTALYSASVTSFGSSFMAGQAYTASNVSGVVRDSLGNPFAGATVVSQGRDYSGLAFSTTATDGTFSLPAKDNASILVYSIAGAQSRTVEASTESGNASTGLDVLLEESSTTITLTWGEDPTDLDSHLWGPTADGSQFHIYYADRSETVAGIEMFLDVDDVTGFGPEVTTIPSFPLQGRYHFLVKLFSGEGTIQNSPARVELNLQGENFVFSPPGGTPDTCWLVFSIDVDSALEGSLIDNSQWEPVSACDRGSAGSSVFKPQAPTSPAMQQILQKYYAN